jgi:hypothetical protein
VAPSSWEDFSFWYMIFYVHPNISISGIPGLSEFLKAANRLDKRMSMSSKFLNGEQRADSEM